MTRDPGDPKILGSVNEIVKSMPPFIEKWAENKVVMEMLLVKLRYVALKIVCFFCDQ